MSINSWTQQRTHTTNILLKIMVIHECFWLAEVHPLDKPFGFDSKKNGAK